MQVSVLRGSGRNLARGCALLILAGTAAGCSSQVARFNSVDDVFTASTSNQRSIINQQPQAQPYPGDVQASAAPVAPAGGGYSQSVSRGSLEPVSAQPLPPPTQPALAPAPKIAAAPAPAPIGAVAAVPSARPFKDADPAAVKMVSGQPAVEAPKLADAKPADKPRQPEVPAEKVAVLPQQPKVKETKAPAALDASAASGQPKQPAQPAVASAAGTYTVQSGDTLSAISKKTGVSVAALKQANGLQDGILRIGQSIKVPAGGAAPSTAVASAKPATDPVATGSTGPTKTAAPASAAGSGALAAYTPPQKDQKVLQQAEQDDSVAPDATGIGKMRWPVRGRVISGFAGGQGRDGIDISVPEGTPVKAAENGVVIYAGDGLKEFGNTVLVRHENGLVTVYGHASSLQVSRGQKVKRGQEIALSGMSGNADAPKLHFEVRKNSAPVDPSGYLE